MCVCVCVCVCVCLCVYGASVRAVTHGAVLSAGSIWQQDWQECRECRCWTCLCVVSLMSVSWHCGLTAGEQGTPHIHLGGLVIQGLWLSVDLIITNSDWFVVKSTGQQMTLLLHAPGRLSRATRCLTSPSRIPMNHAGRVNDLTS